MNQIRIKSEPYNEEGVLNLLVWASSEGFSGFAEVYVTPQHVKNFALRLTAFPASVDDAVVFEYGDESGEYPYHLLMRAEVVDKVGHSAMLVHVSSYVSSPHVAKAEFRVMSEPASINEFGRCLARWVDSPYEALVWKPKA
ncbi:MAG: hypothetical protein QE485_10055 [Acidovorax sp.]|uniref:hypothetical protein n=1 Tax=Acidovorax sp. TaxID=1872122 RepID=UPI00261F59B6|nr:hypothetical protein [Acidovorax sp.]MDH4417558.1 hypothetical protein [Acidovorax sp.]